MKSIYYTIPISLAFIFCSCTPGKKENNASSENDSTEVVDVLEFETFTYNKNERLAETDNAVGYELNIETEFAKPTSIVADSINKALIASIFDMQSLYPKECFDKFIESTRMEWNEELLDLYEPGEDNATLNYSLNIKCRRNSNSPEGIITFTEDFDTYQGGAHGSYYTFYYNFRESDGHLLKLNEVYNGDPLPAILEQLLRDNDCKTRDELMEKTGILMLGELFPTENFLLKGDKITFHYQIYDIAPYASGAISVTIPWKKF